MPGAVCILVQSTGVSPIFFIHLPKAAGTSIRQAALEQFPKDRVLMLYGRDSQWTSQTAKIIISRHHPREGRAKAISDFIVTNQIAFFASHYPMAQLPCFDPSRAFTIMREPVERVLSHYLFLRRKGLTAVTLDAFVEDRAHQNMQARLLEGVEIEDLGCVGLVERYAEFVRRLNDHFGLSFGVAHRKRGGVLKELKARMASQRIRRRIEALNEADGVLYERARRLDRDARLSNSEPGAR